MEEPQIAPKPAHAEIAAIALPPRNQLSHELAAANNALLRPILEANAPIKINRGTTDKS